MSTIEQWGNSTWYLFHIIAENITDNIFTKERNNLINMVKQICSMLPCPDCAKHATDLLNRYNFNLLKTREDFKNFLFQFHNKVNSNTNKKIFTKEELDEKYKKTNLSASINYFSACFFMKTNNQNLLLHSFQRNNIKNTLIKYLFSLDEAINRENM